MSLDPDFVEACSTSALLLTCDFTFGDNKFDEDSFLRRFPVDEGDERLLENLENKLPEPLPLLLEAFDKINVRIRTRV